ncbi:MAG: zf-HC2 domain-containing protein [Armatimonadetes bacterium]|nr:zf-HC2 domain-containing protein [Armatimonadota bacterium]
MSAPDPQKCPNIQEWLNAWLDEELTPEELEKVERHLAGCSVCGEEVRLLRAASRAMRGLPRPLPGKALHRRVMAQVRADAETRRQSAVIRTFTVVTGEGFYRARSEITGTPPGLSGATPSEESPSSFHRRQWRTEGGRAVIETIQRAA